MLDIFWYRAVHSAISPLTADFATFCGALPSRALYSTAGGRVRYFAFVEENEIAYIGGVTMGGFLPFAEGVATWLLAQYPVVSFECDDCDEMSMALKGLFSAAPSARRDTYILNAG